MHTPFYPFHWLAFEPNSLTVHGQHFPESLPVHPRLADSFKTQLPVVRERILSTPGGFEGHCAALLHWEYEPARENRPAQLRIATGYRPYSQGQTLKTVLVEQAPQQAPNALLPTHIAPGIQPIPGLSWGSSLTTVVLLPGNCVLAGHRSPHMQTNASLWACHFTEALEPSDIEARSMDETLHRLAREELADLGTLGTHRFVGLALLPLSYTWTLVSALDLRGVSQERLDASLNALRPDAETQAWAIHALGDTSLPLVPDTKNLLGLALARDVAARLAQ